LGLSSAQILHSVAAGGRGKVKSGHTTKESAMKYCKTENTMSLLGGALLGAAAMYLMDPQMGRKRRAYIKDNAGDYLENAGEMLQGGWESARGSARGVAHSVAEKAKAYSQNLSDLAQDYSERLSDHAKGVASSWADQAGDVGSDWSNRAQGAAKGVRSGLAGTIEDWRSRGRKFLSRYAADARGYAADRADDASDVSRDYASRANNYADDITDYAHGLWKQVRGMGHRLGARGEDAAHDARGMAGEEHTPVLPITLTAVGCCAMGVGLMYMMDPQRGRQRRAWLSDTLTGWVRNTGKSFYRTGKDVANRAYGTATGAGTGAQPRGPLYSEELRDRVQSEISRVAPQCRTVQVMADINGSVTLTGSARAEDSDRILAAVEDVDGVNLVINRLEVGSSQSTGGQGVPQL
jgi:gas vesicle protein